MPSSNVSWGIEVGSGAIKAIKLVNEGDSITVADFVLIPHKRVLTTPGIDQADAVRVALGSFMSQYRDDLRGTAVAVSVPGSAAFARFAKLPPVEPKEVPGLIKFEAVQQIPFPIEDVEWDYQTFVSEDSPDIEVGIFAMTKEKVGEILALYKDLDLTPDIINLSPVAAYNAIAYDLNFSETTPGTVILDIGSNSTDLIVAESGKVWVRTFPMGGHAFTEAIAQAFKLPYPKAEKLKREIETSKYKKNITQALKPIYADFFQDVQRSISYYQDTHPDANLKRIIGIGSSFKLLGMRRLLSQQTKLEVYRLDQFKRLSVDGPGAADFEAATLNMTTAYGLALQGLGLETIRANLMPTTVVREAVWKAKTPWFVTAAVIGTLAGGVLFIRPFLDSTASTQALNNTAITSMVNSTVNEGNKLKSEWQQVSEQTQPGYVAENIRRLVGATGIFNFVMDDVEELIHTNDLARNPGEPYRLIRFESSYLAPGTDIASDRGMATSGGGRGRARSGDTAGQPEQDLKVGPLGAIRVRLELDTSSPEPPTPYVNETIVAWLTQNADRADRPYTIVAIPQAESIPRADQSNAAAPPEIERNDKDAMPPLPADIGRRRPAPARHRFTVTYTYQLRELPDPAAAQGDADTTETSS
ncbi:MAG: type IV pilus assembly protein PilM [Phycisphaerales bacterium]